MAVSAVVRRASTHDGAASVLSPFSDANLAEGCTKVRQLSAMLEYARIAIVKWIGAGWETIRSRCVTPLCAVIAHKGLWERSHEIRRQQDAEKERRAREL